MLTFVTSLDSNFIKPTSVMLVSLDRNLEVMAKCIILTKIEDLLKVEACISKLPTSKLSFDYVAVHEDKFNSILNMDGILHFSNAATYRLLASTLINDEVDTIIYLDGDILVRSSINPSTFPSVTFAALIELHPDSNVVYLPGYVNSGVYTTQLSYWRTHKCEAKLIEFLKKNPQSIYKDQDALNAIFSHLNSEPLVKDLNYIIQDYNFIHNLFSNPKIVHFAGPLKPWKLTTPNSKFVNEWRILANELQLYPPQKIGLSDLILRVAYTLRIHFLVRRLRKLFW